MKRFAAHRICFSPQTQYDTAYIELDRQNGLIKTAPLDRELESTVFLNGILLMVPARMFADADEAAEHIDGILARTPGTTLADLLRKAEITDTACIGARYYLLHLENFDFECDRPRQGNAPFVKAIHSDETHP